MILWLEICCVENGENRMKVKKLQMRYRTEADVWKNRVVEAGF